MRLITRKQIWRAFPELDAYDDETCLRYIKQGKRRKPRVSAAFMYGLAIFVALTIWFICSYFAFEIYDNIGDKVLNGNAGVWIHLGLVTVVLGVIWMPCIAALRTRDKLLHDRVLERIDGVRCFDCSYTLIGLDPYEIEGRHGVRCPECGTEHDFQSGLLTEADINPNLASLNPAAPADA